MPYRTAPKCPLGCHCTCNPINLKCFRHEFFCGHLPLLFPFRSGGWNPSFFPTGFPSIFIIFRSISIDDMPFWMHGLACPNGIGKIVRPSMDHIRHKDKRNMMWVLFHIFALNVIYFSFESQPEPAVSIPAFSPTTPVRILIKICNRSCPFEIFSGSTIALRYHKFYR